jgi:hypothetical protein
MPPDIENRNVWSSVRREKPGVAKQVIFYGAWREMNKYLT